MLLLFFVFVLTTHLKAPLEHFSAIHNVYIILSAKPQIFLSTFTLLPLNSVSLCSAFQCQCKQQCTAQAAVPPASFKDKPVVSLSAHTVCLSAFDSKSHNWLFIPYSQTSFCAVLHKARFFFPVFFAFLIRKIHGAINSSISNLNFIHICL